MPSDLAEERVGYIEQAHLEFRQNICPNCWIPLNHNSGESVLASWRVDSGRWKQHLEVETQPYMYVYIYIYTKQQEEQEHS